MSRFFKSLRKIQQQVTQQDSAASENVQQLLEKIKGGGNVADDLADARLSQCRTTRLMPSADNLLISNSNQPVPAECYRALRTRLMRLQAAGGIRSVVLSSAGRGEGKTLTAVNLALCYAQLPGVRILLVDADLRRRGLSQLLGFPPSPELADVLSDQVGFERAIVATQVSNFYAMPAGSPLIPPPELFAGPRWKELIGWSSECFKIILVDSPPILPLADFELIAAGCDGVLVLVRALSTERESLRKAVNLIDVKKLLGVVMNDIQNSSRDHDYHYGSNHNERGRA